MDNQNSNNPYLQMVPAPPNAHGSTTDGSGRRPMDGIYEALHNCGRRVEAVTRKAEIYADNLWNHIRASPSLADVAMARIAQGTKVLTEGGHDKVFHQTFGTLPGEKLLKAYVCYLSTSSGPVIGTLYISNKKVAFCSDNRLCYHSSPGQQQWTYYKVVVPLAQLRTANPSSNIVNPSEKYIQIVTMDGREFWFMGFISYDKALSQLTEALRRSRSNFAEEIPVA